MVVVTLGGGLAVDAYIYHGAQHDERVVGWRRRALHCARLGVQYSGLVIGYVLCLLILVSCVRGVGHNGCCKELDEGGDCRHGHGHFDTFVYWLCWWSWCDLGSWRPGVAAGQAGVFSVVVRGQGGRQAGCGLGMEGDYVSFFRLSWRWLDVKSRMGRRWRGWGGDGKDRLVFLSLLYAYSIDRCVMKHYLYSSLCHELHMTLGIM
ncbi:putative leucine-rich repeat extensin-like protein 7 [Iris pallida]|uniref:Leucine-rich repeat extensin-like protein 7 n=1 Tax=Iris pallida TaxID=29817 RepID=A0AAX6HJW0_IRIPA|nr:putative leucine-rich repeat extensin-like protein 7 [Iris pallida]